jgi:hypothetical protein
MTLRATSLAVSLAVEVFESQPDAPDSYIPLSTLAAVSGKLTDDASQLTQRKMSMSLSTTPDFLRAGMWIRPTIGIQRIKPILYRLPSMIITDIVADLERFGGSRIEAADPSVVLDGRPYASDTTLTGTLRSLVGEACTTALARITDVSQVPDVALPHGSVAEFGSGRWDVCVRLADALGVALMFTDPGDVIGRYRNAAPPASVANVERALLPGGSRHSVRIPSAAQVLVTRGGDTPGLVGNATAQAVLGTPLPSWYRPYVISDRHEGDPATTQAEADSLAADLIRVRVSELDSYDALPILPAPWLEAGDVVTFGGNPYGVRAVTLDVPSLATAITLRRVST